MTEDESKILKRIVWDYDISPKDIFLVIKGKKEKAGHFDFDKIFIRLLERTDWYSILDLVGIEKIKERLTPEIIERLRYPELKIKYERLRKILHGETVPFAEWGPEFSEKIKYKLFSNRWYSSEQTLF